MPPAAEKTHAANAIVPVASTQGQTMPSSMFTSTDSAFSDYLAGFPQQALPLSWPLADTVMQAMKKRPVERTAYGRYLCDTGFFDCQLEAQRNEFFRGYRVALSPQAVGLLYYGIGDSAVQLVLITYDVSGRAQAGLVIAGSFGDLEWGYDGAIEADKTIRRDRYVWVDGEEKEYVRDRSYRITPAGLIEETI